MDYRTYLMRVKTNFPDTKAIAIGNFDTVAAYEEVFKWKWAATKLKIFSFIAFSDAMSIGQLEPYSSACVTYARKNKKGLPVGFQNGLVCNNILVAETVDDGVIACVTSRPKKHYSILEMPIIFDLSKKQLFYYSDEIIWGKMYQSFIKEYIVKNFSI